MFYPEALTRTEEEAFALELVSQTRTVQVEAFFYTRNGDKLNVDLKLLGGQVTFDMTARKKQPTRTANVTLLDEKERLTVNATQPWDGGLWFSKQLGIVYKVWLRDYSKWVVIPVFRGPIFEVARYGAEVEIDAYGKEAQHLDPYVFHETVSVRRHARVSAAIRKVMRVRGEDQFDIPDLYKRLNRDRSWGLGQSPWRAVQNLADVVDRQLYYRGNGVLRLRKWPDQVSWKFFEGALPPPGSRTTITDYPTNRMSLDPVFDMIVVKGERAVKTEVKTSTSLKERSVVGDTNVKVKSTDKFVAGRKIEIGGKAGKGESRTISSVNTGTGQVNFASALVRNHAKGANVSVTHVGEKTVKVVGRATLESNHPLSAFQLTGSPPRHRVRIEERPNIHKKETARERAESLLRKQKTGIEQDFSFSTIPIPHLEEGDIVVVAAGNEVRQVMVRKLSLPLDPSESMEVNWITERAPKRRPGKGRR